jgi:hypothetical protein
MATSGGPDGGVNLAVFSQPVDVAAFRVFVDFLEELNCFRFQARFRLIAGRNYHFDFDGNDESIGLDQPRSLYSLACNSH